jgi:hypothetical protein
LTATSVGFAVYMVGVIGQVAAAVVFDPTIDAGYRILVSFLPFCLLAKGMIDLGARSDGENDTGLRWSDRNSYAEYSLGTC